MKTEYLILIFAVIVFSLVAYSCTYEENTIINYHYTPIKKIDGTADENEFVRLVNEYRISQGLNPLIHEVLSSEVCKIRNLQDIENNIPPSHVGWSTMLSDAMVQPNNGSHIWGYNHLTPLTLFNAYLNSPDGHQEALEMDATHIGTSIIERRNYTLIIKY